MSKKGDNYMYGDFARNPEIIQQMVSALDLQVGGDHYKGCGIQPVEYIHANNLGYLEGNVIKYITRHRTKGEGRKDIEKAIHYAQLILELEYNQKETSTNDHQT
jgi:hypothetical protein